jgi:nucleoside-diphosphate-sugar epimerase
MRVFVTGATGFVGSAVTAELIRAGHQVLGLVRSDTGAKSLAAAGAQVHRGDITDPQSLRSGAAGADGVIHTAFIHDFSKFKESCEVDRRAIEALGEALAGPDRPLIVTSGTGLVTPGRLGTENDAPFSGPGAMPRVASEQAVQSLAARGLNVSLVRLPPSVHGQGDHAFVPLLMRIAREKGASAYIGEGANRWPAVHRFDAAKLYKLILERKSPGATYHAVAEEGIAFRDIAAAIGRLLNVPVVSKSPAEAADHFGWFAHFAALNNPTSAALTQSLTGWRPAHPSLLADLGSGAYDVG